MDSCLCPLCALNTSTGRTERAETEKQTDIWKSLGITVKGLLYIVKVQPQQLQTFVKY